MAASGRQSTPMVSLQGVNKHFGGGHVLKDLNLDVDRGEAVVILGKILRH